MRLTLPMVSGQEFPSAYRNQYFPNEGTYGILARVNSGTAPNVWHCAHAVPPAVNVPPTSNLWTNST